MLIIMIILPTNWIQAPCHGQVNLKIVLTTTRHIHPSEQTLSVSVVSDIYEEKCDLRGLRHQSRNDL